MEVELQSDSCDPLHIPCVLIKLETDDVLQESQHIFSLQQQEWRVIGDAEIRDVGTDVNMIETPQHHIQESDDDDRWLEEAPCSDTETTVSSHNELLLQATHNEGTTPVLLPAQIIEPQCNDMSSHNEDTPVILPVQKVGGKTQVKCPHCETKLQYKSLKKHIKRKHAISLESCKINENSDISVKTCDSDSNCNVKIHPELLENVTTNEILENSVIMSEEISDLVETMTETDIKNGKELNSNLIVQNTAKNVIKINESLLVTPVNIVKPKNKKNVGKKVKCKYCNVTLTEKCLTTHVKTLHKEHCFSCSRCTFVTVNKQRLEHHIVNNEHVHKNKCTKCKKIFDNLMNFKYHENHECEIFCILCEISFKNESELKNHITEIHSCLNVTNNQLNQLFLHKISVNIGKNNKLADKKQCKDKDSVKNHVLKCHNCAFKTRNKNYLVAHMKKSHLKLQTECKICHFKAENYQDLQKHIFYLHDGKNFKCKNCKLETKYKGTLKLHSKQCQYSNNNLRGQQCQFSNNRIINKTDTFKCNICQKSFLKLRNLKMHIKNHLKIDTKSKNTQRFRCKMCGRWYSSKIVLQEHKNYLCIYRPNMIENYFYCDLCPFKSKIKKYLQTHLTRTHRFTDKIYKCKKCGKTYSRHAIFQNHVKTHGAKNLACRLCSSKFVLQIDLEKHLKSVHKQKLNFNCSFCDKVFDTRYERHRHELAKHRIVKDKNLRPHKCQFCPKSFKINSALQRHINNIHRVVKKTHICEHCGKFFKKPYSLRLHILKQHDSNSEELFSCDFCDKKYLSKKLKIGHEISVHKKNTKVIEPKFKEIFQRKKSTKVAKIDEDLIPELTCQICGKIATSKCNLRAHIYLRHSDLRPFKCDECDTTFKYKRDLRNHTMSHTKVLPFKCPSCTFATKMKISLQFHVMNMHTQI